MDSIKARRIVNDATRKDPALKAALEHLFAERVELGAFFERQALSGVRADQGKDGGRPRWPHWDIVLELDAGIGPTIKAKTHRAQIIKGRLIERGVQKIPSVKKLAEGLPKK
ncbi:hypothetical protein [Falsiruegeria litorea]|uniref:hypothetical protein n=1 Tax=Falsiruegeria litorea TaxID=1280831 RepID=UPI001BFE67F1|nr:hypothetical protein [Falsiruegeria litorea]MBT8169659.1 hypothetical protein [Falsiruegeria litorea]